MGGVVLRTGEIRGPFNGATQVGASTNVTTVMTPHRECAGEQCCFTEVRSKTTPEPVVRPAGVHNSSVHFKPVKRGATENRQQYRQRQRHATEDHHLESTWNSVIEGEKSLLSVFKLAGYLGVCQGRSSAGIFVDGHDYLPFNRNENEGTFRLLETCE